MMNELLHIAGQPRRHLLTTGWSAFVNKKKLVSGDAVLFLRCEKLNLARSSALCYFISHVPIILVGLVMESLG